MKYLLAILKNETQFDHEPWISSCEKKQDIILYDVIDITETNWLSRVTAKNYDFYLLRPPGRLEHFKRLYDERVFIISEVLKKMVYPSPAEVFIYENKRLLNDWLSANNIPHPGTFVFYSEKKASDFANSRNIFPVVGKTNIGASGSGVVLINTRQDLLRYSKEAFVTGVGTKTGPKFSKGSLITKIKKAVTKKGFIKQRLKDYSSTASQKQKGFIILQEFILHTYEWRCVRIGDSFFAHKKIAKNNKSSGTLLKAYDSVPHSLLEFIKTITDKTGIASVAIDVFTKDNTFLVNEIQCFFGQSDPYQMLVDGKPGRYRFIENKWVFEEGMFNGNLSYDLRLEHALSLIKDKLK